MTDQAAIYTKLRAEAAKLLNLDVAKLSALESMHVDLVGVLMLEIDTLQAQQLSGKQIDISRIADAVKILRSLLPSAPLPSVDMAVETDAREKLEALINRQVHALEKRDERENVILKRELAELRAKLRNDAAPPVSADAEVKPQDATPPQAASPTATQSPPPPPTLRAEPPTHYLRRNDGFDVIQGGRYDRWSNRG